jgi:hypothetical protein
MVNAWLMRGQCVVSQNPKGSQQVPGAAKSLGPLEGTAVYGHDGSWVSMYSFPGAFFQITARDNVHRSSECTKPWSHSGQAPIHIQTLPRISDDTWVLGVVGSGTFRSQEHWLVGGGGEDWLTWLGLICFLVSLPSFSSANVILLAVAPHHHSISFTSWP